MVTNEYPFVVNYVFCQYKSPKRIFFKLNNNARGRAQGFKEHTPSIFWVLQISSGSMLFRPCFPLSISDSDKLQY